MGGCGLERMQTRGVGGVIKVGSGPGYALAEHTG